MSSPKYKLLSTEFKTKREFSEWVRKWIHENEGRHQSPSTQYQLLRELANRLDYLANKSIKTFIVEGSSVWYTLTGRRGPRKPMSWRRCISRTNVSEKQKLNQAMRRAISSQIRWQWQYLTNTELNNGRVPKCAVCEVITPKLEVDHVAPNTYSALRDEFLFTHPPPTNFWYNQRARRYCFCNNAIDKKFRLEWETFHLDRARYQLVCAVCNKLLWQSVRTKKIDN